MTVLLKVAVHDNKVGGKTTVHKHGVVGYCCAALQKLELFPAGANPGEYSLIISMKYEGGGDLHKHPLIHSLLPGVSFKVRECAFEKPNIHIYLPNLRIRGDELVTALRVLSMGTFERWKSSFYGVSQGSYMHDYDSIPCPTSASRERVSAWLTADTSRPIYAISEQELLFDKDPEVVAARWDKLALGIRAEGQMPTIIEAGRVIYHKQSRVAEKMKGVALGRPSDYATEVDMELYDGSDYLSVNKPLMV